eukprot:scaffold173208_cov31-Prasinocladus_malaysianus.AAC.1
MAAIWGGMTASQIMSLHCFQGGGESEEDVYLRATAAIDHIASKHAGDDAQRRASDVFKT